MKLLIVDDHPMVRTGIAALLAQAEIDAVILQAHAAPMALDMAAKHPDIDAVMLDLSMPGMDGFTAIAAFQRSNPALPVIVLSSSEEPEHVRRALAMGARGYIPKSAPPGTVVAALRIVLSGEVYLPPLMLSEPMEAAGVDRLTDRQSDVLALLSQGQSNKTIAASLGIAEKTVKAHVGAIFRALNVVNRTQAASQARRIRLPP